MTGTIAILIVVFGGYSTAPIPLAVYSTVDACQQDAKAINEQHQTAVCIPLTHYLYTVPALGAYNRSAAP